MNRTRGSLLLVCTLGASVLLGDPGPASAAAPSNDNRADAIEITSLPYSASDDLEETTIEPDEPKPSCLPAGMGGTVWFTITPTAPTALAVDTWRSTTEVVLAIYREWDSHGTPTILEQACNRRVWTPTDTPPHSHVSGILAANARYFVQVVNLGFCCPGASGMEITFQKRRTTPAVHREDACVYEWNCETLYLNGGFDRGADGVWPYFVPNTATLIVGDWFRRNDFGYGTGIASPAVRRGSNWYLSSGWTEGPHTTRVVPFGRARATPVVGDIEGDGTTDIGVVDGNTWFFDFDHNGLCDYCGYRFGSARDDKFGGDWDGNGTGTPGVRRGIVWHLKNHPSLCCDDANADISFAFGRANDRPIVGDWDGDGDWTVGVIRGNVWYLNNGTGPNADIVFRFGRSTDVQLAGHWGPFAERSY